MARFPPWRCHPASSFSRPWPRTGLRSSPSSSDGWAITRPQRTSSRSRSLAAWIGCHWSRRRASPPGSTGWLRNGVIDHYRRRGASERALASLRNELEEAPPEPSPDERDAVCRCVARLSETLKPEYAQALRRVDVDGVSVRDFASEAAITPNNAAVRLFRARETLRKRVVRWCGSCAERGCVDCSCGEPGTTGCAHET